MDFAKLIRPTALFAAVGTSVSAQAATVLDVDYTPTTAGTPITIGNAAAPQYSFISDPGIGGAKTYLSSTSTATDANPNLIGFPGDPATSLSVNTAFDDDVFGNIFGNDGDYSLLFNIGSDRYQGFATVDRQGKHISRISYDAVGGSALPEPASWATMILGLGVAGAAVRRRRRQADLAIA